MPLVSLEVEDVFWAVLEDLNLEEASNAPPMYVIVLPPFLNVSPLRSSYSDTIADPLPFQSTTTTTNPHTNQPSK